MNKRNIVALLTICAVSDLMAMDWQEIQFKTELKQRVKNNPKAVIPSQQHGQEIKFVVQDNRCGFLWGDMRDSETSIYEECLAQELAPFVFGGRDLGQLNSVTSRYPCVGGDEIFQYIQEIRAVRRPLGIYAQSFQNFMDRYRNLAIAENRQRTVFRIKLAGVTLAVVALVYGIYRIFFAKKAVEEPQDDEQENELQDEKNGTADIDAQPTDV